ncbi:teichoic acids export ABC transporter ATP-binding subunit TagH [Virgibacillus halodenitrificans]|uniref:teichoic acids export ABC transporter ATP-binding subunit TagH n=1 Tax=Virgibacillus halodenitrificans TaxID=1482 RepID=UPI003075E8DC|nr:teichoic acids export ABC transporter ATP-binding subunit TagH [Virgibacillus halodenitrificans]
MEKAIVASNISKKYKLYSGTKERMMDLLLPTSIGEDFYALSDVTFEAGKGDVVGFVGINGSGKSTLSNIVAGIIPPTSGQLDIYGQASLIAVSSGLKNDLSGRDNIELKLLMLGFNKDEIKRLVVPIIEFSELGKFIDQPVKSYSSGMKSRLGFAISVNIDPDILIIDEALSVGDKAFAGKSFDKMMEFKSKGKTMIFISHSIGQMRRFCEKILWLEFGKVKEYGPVEEVLGHYELFLSRWEKMDKQEREKYKEMALNGDDPFKNLNSEDENEAIVIESDDYKEELVSILGHIKAGYSLIYKSPFKLSSGYSSNQYKNSVYYIKKQITFLNEIYYLLSESPSAEKGILGWMKKSDLSLHRHLLIDEEEKTFELSGSGSAFTKPWGGKSDIVYGDLRSLQGQQVSVIRTEKVGKNVWRKCIVKNEEVWIHNKHLIRSRQP